MAWQTGTAGDYVDLLDKLIALAVNRSLATAAVNAGGTGYVVGDMLSISETGGVVEEGLSASVEVTAVSSGVVTAVKVYHGGAYSTDPTTTTANATSGGTGSGCTLDITFADTGWTTHRNSFVSPEREWIAEGTGSGTDEIFVGIRTYRDAGAGAYNLELGGFTGYGSGLDWEQQPGWSNKSTYVPLANTTIAYWLSVTARRIVGVFRIGTTYTNMYLGFLNPFATPSEYPYPLYVAGCASKLNRVYSESNILMSGLCDPVYETSFTGPHALRFTDGQWYPVANSGGANRLKKEDRVVYPCGTIDTTPPNAEDDFTAVVENDESWGAVIGFSGLAPNPIARLHPSPDTGGDITIMLPTIVAFTSPSEQIAGEMSDVFWISTAGSGIVSEDRLIIGSERYFAFQNCNRTDQFAFVAIRQG